MTGLERGLALVDEGIETDDIDLITRGFDRFNVAVDQLVAELKSTKKEKP